MVIVDVQDRHPPRAAAGELFGHDRSVVEEAVAAVHRPRRVVTGRAAQAVGERLSAQHEVRGRQRHVDRRARRGEGARHNGCGRIEAVRPEPRWSRGPRSAVTASREWTHQEGVRNERSGAIGGARRESIGPDVLEQVDQVRIVDVGDRSHAMLGRRQDPTRTRFRQRPFDLGDPLRLLEARHRIATHDLDQAVVGEMRR